MPRRMNGLKMNELLNSNNLSSILQAPVPHFLRRSTFSIFGIDAISIDIKRTAAINYSFFQYSSILNYFCLPNEFLLVNNKFLRGDIYNNSEFILNKIRC